MTSDFASQLFGEMLWTAVIVMTPLLGFTLLVGLVVSVLQVITQIQEMSLTFVPKLATAVIVLAAFGPWMLKKVLAFSTQVIGNIPAYF